MPVMFTCGWGLSPGAVKAEREDGVTEPLPGSCLPPEIVVLLDVLRLLLLLLLEECDSDDIIALPKR